MPIFKFQGSSHYAKIPNATLRDKRLSIEARGTLAYLLTNSNTFELSFEFLQKELGVGRDKMNKVARELKENGYLELRAAHNKKGKFSGQEWLVYAESQNTNFCLTTNNRPTEKPSDVKTVRRENRQTENTEDNLKENSSPKENNKELKENIEKESVCSLGLIARNSKKTRTLEKKFLDNEFFQIYGEYFPNEALTEKQIKVFTNRIRDATIFRKAVAFWSENGYRPQSIGKICDKYDELALEIQNGGQNGNAIVKRDNPANSSETTNQRRDREARERIYAGNSADQLLRQHGII